MSDIVAFLRDRLDEDEWIAQGAERTSGADWHPVALQSHFDARMDDHIARHDPARVLREVEVKRRIVDAYETAQADGLDFTRITALQQVVELLAVVDADHPDYDESWRP